MTEGEDIISDDIKVAETMDTFFAKSILNVNIRGYKIDPLTDTFLDEISKFRNYPSVLK